MLNQTAPEKAAVGGRIKSFLDGYLMPHTAQARLLAGERLLEYVGGDAEYLDSVGREVCGLLDAAVENYAVQS